MSNTEALRKAAEAALEALEVNQWAVAEQAPHSDVMAHADAITKLRAALAQPAAMCACKDRPASDCPGEWEPGCDLGANAAHVVVAQPAASGEPVARGAAYGDALRWTIKACGAVQRDDGVWFGDTAAAKLARVLSEGATAQPAPAPAASGEPAEPFGYVITHNFPEGHAYRYSFYTPKSIGTAYRDTALSITPVFATAQPAPALVPLTHGQIVEALDKAGCPLAYMDYDTDIKIARAIEAAHGIGTPAKEAP